jgi:hypothetical protein
MAAKSHIGFVIWHREIYNVLSLQECPRHGTSLNVKVPLVLSLSKSSNLLLLCICKEYARILVLLSNHSARSLRLGSTNSKFPCSLPFGATLVPYFNTNVNIRSGTALKVKLLQKRHPIWMFLQ